MFYEPLWAYEGYTLVRRPDSKYLYITWCPAGTRRYHRKSTRTSNLKLAQKRLIEFAGLEAASNASPKVPEPHEVSIEDVLTHYLDRHMKPDNPSRRTADSSLVALRAFFASYDLGVVCDLDPEVMDEYPAFRQALSRDNQLMRMRSAKAYEGMSDAELEERVKQVSDATIGRELSVLNAALRFYHKRNRITRIPFIQLPGAVPPRSRWLTPEEFQRLHAAARTQHLRDYMLLAIHTLQRPGFLFDLEIGQVDLARRRIEFLKPGQRQTRKGRPAIRMSESLVPLLDRLIASSESGYIIEYDGRPIRTTLRKSFQTAAIDAGLIDPNDRSAESVCPYTLRHTGATWLAQAGVDLWQIAGMLGHKDTRMVERVYAKHHPEFQRKATETLDRLVPVSEPRAIGAPVPRLSHRLPHN